jgi:K+-sensing histidine kinase KdpD
MGFGLSASLGIIDDHGGRIAIESQIGRGTIVKIKLPSKL